MRSGYSLAGGGDHALPTSAMPAQPPSTETMSTFFCLRPRARCRHRRRRPVDGVDDVDVGFFCRQFSMPVWPLARSPKLSAMQTTLGGRDSSLLFGIVGLQAKALQKAVVPLRTHRVAGEHNPAWRSRASCPQRRPWRTGRSAPARLVVVGGKQRVRRIHGLGGAVERNHSSRHVPAPLDGGHDGLGVAGVMRMVSSACGDQGSPWP